MTKTNILHTVRRKTFYERHFDETFEAEFLDVIGTKVMLFSVNSINGILLSPPPQSLFSKRSLKLVSNGNFE
jgi:hypothetical protein